MTDHRWRTSKLRVLPELKVRARPVKTRCHAVASFVVLVRRAKGSMARWISRCGSVVLTIVIDAGLWERTPREASTREQAILFDVVTVTAVVIGVLSLYLTLLVLPLPQRS
jgi:hypothetical protein